MTIAESIKQNNIAEYILFMWQAEDMVRAFSLDIEKIQSNIVKDFNGEEKDLLSLISWYKDLIRKLRIQGKSKKVT